MGDIFPKYNLLYSKKNNSESLRHSLLDFKCQQKLFLSTQFYRQIDNILQ